MTTHTHHIPIVTATITDGPPPAPGSSTGTGPHEAFTVIVYVNVELHSFFAYEPGHTVAEVTTPDSKPLRLTFRAAVDCQAAADAAFRVGIRQGIDDGEQIWPDDVRLVSVGDVLAVTDPQGSTTYLSIDSIGFSPVSKPRVIVPLGGTVATWRVS